MVCPDREVNPESAAKSGIGTLGIPWALSTGNCGKWTSGFELPYKMPAASWKQWDGGRRGKKCLSSHKEEPSVINSMSGEEAASISQSPRGPSLQISPC